MNRSFSFRHRISFTMHETGILKKSSYERSSFSLSIRLSNVARKGVCELSSDMVRIEGILLLNEYLPVSRSVTETWLRGKTGRRLIHLLGIDDKTHNLLSETKSWFIYV